MYRVFLIPLLAAMSAASLGGDIETVEVIGSRAGVPPQQLTGHVSVLDREAIEALHKSSVQQLLQGFTGVSINQQGGAGGVSSLYVRGGEANFTVILIDGIQVNNPADTRGGSFDFSTLDPSQVERIELIRGPQSALYGADALSGVLNIVTRQAAGTEASRVFAEGGTDSYYRGSASFAGSLGDAGSFSVLLGRSDNGDVVEDSKRELDYLSAAAAYDISQSTTVSLGLRYSDTERENYPEDSGGPDLAVWDELDQGDSEDLSLQLSLRSKMSERWQTALEAEWFNVDSSESSPGIFPGSEVPPTGADVNFDRYQLSWVNQFQLDQLRLGFGLELEREEGESDGYIDFGVLLDASFELERDSAGAFAEAYYDVGDALSLSASLRYDDVDEADSETTGSLGFRWQVFAETAVSGNWGEGFKPPSFFALAHPLVGNPELQSETSSSWEIAIQHRFNDVLSSKLVYFDVTYRDLIDFDDEAFTNVNRDRVETEGVEWSVLADTSYGRWSGHATWTDSDVANLDEELRGRPEWKAGVQWFYAIRSDIDLAVEYLWVDEVVEASRHTLESVDYTLDAYDTLDVSMTWRLDEAISLRATVSNVLDENYEQAVGFPAAGIFPRLGIEWRL